MDKTHERCLPNNKLNVDQSPFVVEQDKTNGIAGKEASMDFPASFWPRQEASNVPTLH